MNNVLCIGLIDAQKWMKAIRQQTAANMDVHGTIEKVHRSSWSKNMTKKSNTIDGKQKIAINDAQVPKRSAPRLRGQSIFFEKKWDDDVR